MTENEIKSTFDPQVYAKQRIANTQPELAWKSQTLDEMQEWQTNLRARIRVLIGAVDSPHLPLNARIEKVERLAGYRRETIVFDSRPGLQAMGYFLLPDDCKSARPAMLCLPGHGRGVDSLVGIAEDGSQRELNQPDEYMADFALQCVAQGYPTFALEQISFGHRRDAEAHAQGGAASSCVRDSMAALMLGETITGWRVWDAMRALDYLETRPEVDAKHLGVMGISGGGLTALFTACLDTRLQACVVSGYFNTFQASILAVNHCVDNYVPHLLNVVEMPDMAGLIAPRALFVESGKNDLIFPLPAFQKAMERAREIYAAFQSADRFDAEIFDGGHQFHGKAAFPFLRQNLGG